MLDTSPDNLMEEIQAAERLRDRHLEKTDEMIREYHGQAYDSGRPSEKPAPENHAFEWLSLVTPQIIYDNPEVMVRSRRSGIDPEILTQLQYGIQQWADDTLLWRTLMDCWYDMAFSFGVIHSTIEVIPYYKGNQGVRPMRPCARRIKPQRFFVDCRADAPSNARLMGHFGFYDKNDLLEDPRFVTENVRSLRLGRWKSARSNCRS